MRPKTTPAEHDIAQIASRQHGNVSIGQLLEVGLTREGVKRRVRKGLLHREFRGVYRVGHRAPSTEADYMAAVLASGDDSALSGMAAVHMYGLVKGGPPVPEVTSTARRRIAGVVTHRARQLDPSDVTVYRRIPITTIPRTIVDISPRLSLDDLSRVCHEAEVRHGTRASQVIAAIARREGMPGAGKLRQIYHGDAHSVLSELERAFLDVLRAEGLPLPRTNRPAGGRYVDCRWPERRLTVELDGYRYHHTRHAWEQDRRRAREARVRGDEFRRYTYADVTEDRELMLNELRALLPALPSPGLAR